MSDPTPLSIDDIVRLVRASAESIATEVRALGPLAVVRPAAGEWCGNEVIGHLIETDRRTPASRVRTMIAEDRPAFEKWDQPAAAAARRDHERDTESLLAEFLAARGADIAYVSTLDASVFSRVGVHPRQGEMTAEAMLRKWVRHDREHLAQILAVTDHLAR